MAINRYLKHSFLLIFWLTGLLVQGSVAVAATYPDRIPSSVVLLDSPIAPALDWHPPRIVGGLIGYRLWRYDLSNKMAGYQFLCDVPAQALEKSLDGIPRDHESYLALAALYGSVGKPWVGEKVIVRLPTNAGSNLDLKSSANAPGNSGPRPTRMGATWRSALVPGWGQWYRGQTWLGAGYLGATVICLGGTYMYDQGGNAAYTSYKAASSKADATKFYDQVVSQDKMYTALGYLAIGVYAVNLLDAVLFTDGFPGTKLSKISNKEFESTNLCFWTDAAGSNGLQWRFKL